MILINHTKIRLSGKDALRALFGRAITINTHIEVTTDTEVLGTTQSAYVDTLFPRRPMQMATTAVAQSGNRTTCLAPPQGWVCTRPAGHDGPCAAHQLNP